MGGNESDGARLFSVVPCEKTRGKRQKFKHMKFILNTRKHILQCGWSKTGTGCPEWLWNLHPWRY